MPPSFQTDLCGEIQNTGSEWVTSISLIAKFYDERGYLLQECYASPFHAYLPFPPGEKSPFVFASFPTPGSLNYFPYSNYTLEVSYSIATPFVYSAKIEILNVELKITKSSYLKIEVHNAGTGRGGAFLLVTFYDDQGGVLSFGDTGTSLLLPNQVETVELRPYAGLESGYGVYAVSNNYSLRVVYNPSY